MFMEFSGFYGDTSERIILRRNEDVLHHCSFCNKGFRSLQALGGHQTIHRGEISQMRQRHDAYMRAHNRRGNHVKEVGERRQAGGDGGAVGGTSEGSHLRMVPLDPNRAFWEAHKNLNCEPMLHDFFAVSEHWASVLDGIVAEVSPEHLFYDGNIDLDLKL